MVGGGSVCGLALERGVSGVDVVEVVVVLSEVAMAELRTASEAAGWLCVVLVFSVAALSESPEQLAASKAVRPRRQKARKQRGNSRSIDI